MPSRWCLCAQALFLRFLMRIGMFLHDMASPRPPHPTFTRIIPVASGRRSKIKLHFYCPPDYAQRQRQGHRIPVMVNFHGGGFTLGCATDDGRWAQKVVQDVGAVVVSVGYRRAPEHPFPAAVDDGVDALLYLAANAAELGLDVSRLVLSGFSAGGNLAVTVPLRLHSLTPNDGHSKSAVSTPAQTPTLNRAESNQRLVDSTDSLHIAALFCWYPILDFEESRDLRRQMSLMPSKTLSPFFTTLFDESYLPGLEERRSPYASPARAPNDLLSDGLPSHIFFYICEWDMLMNEGQQFVLRLQGLGKQVHAMMIEKARHAWDKSPNPFRNQRQVNVLYSNACADMKAIFS